MRASLVHRVGILVVTAALLACGASSSCPPPVYSQYSLDATRHPGSIDCFYECLKSKSEPSRQSCFTLCEGVVATTTRAPCLEDTPALCRGYVLEVPECEGDVASDLAFGVVEAVIDSAIDGDDDDDDDDDDDVEHDDDGDGERSAAQTESRARRKASSTPSKEYTSTSPRIAAPPSSFRSKAKKR